MIWFCQKKLIACILVMLVEKVVQFVYVLPPFATILRYFSLQPLSSTQAYASRRRVMILFYWYLYTMFSISELLRLQVEAVYSSQFLYLKLSHMYHNETHMERFRGIQSQINDSPLLISIINQTNTWFAGNQPVRPSVESCLWLSIVQGWGHAVSTDSICTCGVM